MWSINGGSFVSMYRYNENVMLNRLCLYWVKWMDTTTGSRGHLFTPF